MAGRNGAADSDPRRLGRPGGRMSGVLARIGRNWRALSSEQRLAAIAALLLLASMFLPWYQETGNALVGKSLQQIDDSKSAFGVYSFVEAAIFVVVVGVLVLLWARAERKAFHLPGGDGTVIMGAGLWVMFLIFYRQLDKPNGRKEGLIQTSIGVEWGIFIAFLLGALLAYAGYRIRSAHVPEPVVDDAPPPEAETVPAPAAAAEQPPREPPVSGDPPDDEPTVVARRRQRPGADEVFDGQLSFDEPTEYRPPPRRQRS
jgi:hypothetical protein